MTNTVTTINTDHPRIKNRSFADQDYRDNLAKALTQKKAAGNNNEAYDELSKISTSYAYVTQKYGYTKKAALLLISYGNGKDVIENRRRFEGRMDKELFLALLNERDGYRYDNRIYDNDSGTYLKNKIAENYLSKIKNLDKAMAKALIEKGLRSYVIENITLFSGLDEEIADEIICYKKGGYSRLGPICIMKNLSLFTGLNHSDIAKRLVEMGAGEVLADNIENMQNIDYQEIADMLINDKQHYYYESSPGRITRMSSFSDRGLMRNIDKFTGLNPKEIKKRLSENGCRRYF